MISYSNLLQKLNEKGLTKTALAKELGISSRTVARMTYHFNHIEGSRLSEDQTRLRECCKRYGYSALDLPYRYPIPQTVS